MPSQEKTQNIGLNQWQGNEYIKRQDFVEDNFKIDEAIHSQGQQVQQVSEDFELHRADYIRQPGYGTTGGSANNYIITLNPSLMSYVEGVCVAVKIHAANTGDSTLNINGLGGKAIKDSKGNPLTAGKLILNGVYTLRYDGTNFILQGEGGSGNATASDLLSGKTASTDAGDIVGTMPNKGAKTFTPSGLVQTDTAGYYSSVTCNAVNVPAANVLAGTTIAGIAGTMANRGNANSSLTSQGGQYIIPQGYHAGAGTVTANISNLSAGNVRKGAAVGGVTGTYSDMPSGEVPSAGEILTGKSAFANGGGKIAGTMPNRGTVNNTITTQNGQYTIPAGYHSGSGKITASFANLVPENIKRGVNIGGVVGSTGTFHTTSGTTHTIGHWSVEDRNVGDYQTLIEVSNFQMSGTIRVEARGWHNSTAATYIRVLSDGVVVREGSAPWGHSGHTVHLIINDLNMPTQTLTLQAKSDGSSNRYSGTLTILIASLPFIVHRPY
ncbi:hypothetical protein [Alkaliphilus peptidifermentans]|uniref:Uncharacterized protein n=1 Tax=Alkaliphilus peptidifermentans DSM 18978 TaxID=1120976 RepID=A0A1G5JXI2_9FIRM|nr:hypothetical protein [Alkaliphilus peptidifermentans]SCY92864.1 hypothetical protein SAMN03080606_03088 [Alkaliphilus peptidifermentans DSM 18978]